MSKYYNPSELINLDKVFFGLLICFKLAQLISEQQHIY